MKKLIILCLAVHAFAIDKVVIWGHKLHSHTHSYIHNGFYIAFKHLGYDTYWFDNLDDVSQVDFSNSLFLTEGQVDQNIPLRSDCIYILHNVDGSKYKDIPKKITLQVYTDDVLRYHLHQVEPCIYYDIKDLAIYMPWATDLLPDEIEAMKSTILEKTDQIFWIGTVGDGIFGNRSELMPFINACEKNKITFNVKHYKSTEEHKILIAKSYMAPAIVGSWQKEKGYIPCRIFKNISYGQIGITNSKRVYELFGQKIVYDPNTSQLFYKAKEKLEKLDKTELMELMDLVKNKHTYVQRIQTILRFIDLCKF